MFTRAADMIFKKIFLEQDAGVVELFLLVVNLVREKLSSSETGETSGSSTPS